MSYPVEWESDVLLTDGTPVHVRPIRPDDTLAHRRFFGRLSEESIYFRLFAPRKRLTDEEVRRFVEVDYEDRFALVAFVGEDMVAVARFDRLSDPDEAEVAFVVEDDYQGRGLGTLLLEHLAAAARERHVERFLADVLPANHHMLAVFHNVGFLVVDRLVDGVIRVGVAIDPTPDARGRVEEREHTAAARSVQRLLTPRSVAVIGASNDATSVGHHLFANLLAGGFDGPVHPVNPNADHVRSVPAYASLLDIPGPVDLAVVAVPAAMVGRVVEDGAAKGVRGLVVVSAGFAETGAEGAALEREVTEQARRAGMRLVGPNCIGVVNTAVGLNATFSPFGPVPGRMGFSSQSGALGIALLEWSARRGIGVSSFVSVGNKADVSGVDLLQYWEDDPATDLILLYLESFGAPRAFSRIARRVSQAKPIVAVKAGRSEAGTRAAGSHTGAMASSDTAVDALFRQAGVIRVDTLEQLLDVAQVLALQPLPRGRRVAVVGNSGGPGILAADACSSAGLELSHLSPSTTEALRDLLGPAASVGNPVDMIASASPEQYREALDLVLADERVDAVLVIFTPPLVTDPQAVVDAISVVARDATKPVIANHLASPELGGRDDVAGGVPAFRSPEPAAWALARIADYAQWRARDHGSVPSHDDLDVGRGRQVVRQALLGRPQGGWLTPEEGADLLDSFGVPVVEWRRCATADEAVDAGEALGYPVVVKAGSPDLVHKSDRGAVHIDIGSGSELRQAWASMSASLGDAMGGALVQAHVAAGVETIVGVVHDHSFGPLVMFGLGGVATELLGDQAFRLVPLTDADAADLVRAIRGAPLLFGYRGGPTVDVATLEDLLIRIGRLAELVPEVAELDLNPVIAKTDGAVVVDWRIRVEPWAPDPDLVRRLR